MAELPWAWKPGAASKCRRERDSGPWHADKKCKANSTYAPSKRSAVPMVALKLCSIFSVVHACDLIIDHVVSAASDTCGY